MRRRFGFTNHFFRDKDVEPSLAKDCVLTGKKVLDEKPDKFKSMKRYRKGVLVVVWKDFGEKCVVITAYWKN